MTWKRDPVLSEQGLQTIKRRVGPDRYERLLETARRVFGNLEPEDLEELEEEFGSFAFMDAALKLAEHYGEPLPREAAINAMFGQVKIQELLADGDFSQRYLDGEPAAAAAMAAAHEAAFPEPPQPMNPVLTTTVAPGDLSAAPAGAPAEPEAERG